MSKNINYIRAFSYVATDGESFNEFYIFKSDDPMAVQAYMYDNKVMIAEHCEHDYDCCGRYYGDNAKVIGFDADTNNVIVSRTFKQNI